MKLQIGGRYVACTPNTRVMVFTVRDRKDLRLFNRMMKESNVTFLPA
jgi:hypothetical protein